MKLCLQVRNKALLKGEKQKEKNIIIRERERERGRDCKKSMYESAGSKTTKRIQIHFPPDHPNQIQYYVFHGC